MANVLWTIPRGFRTSEKGGLKDWAEVLCFLWFLGNLDSWNSLQDENKESNEIQGSPRPMDCLMSQLLGCEMKKVTMDSYYLGSNTCK